MSERYFSKVVSIIDDYKVVMKKGAEDGVKEGDRFVLVGIGPMILDPDTGEQLEPLEIVRGRVTVTHVQSHISTLESDEYEKEKDIREIKKVSSKSSALLGIISPQDTVTESIKPGDMRLRKLKGASVGDVLIRVK